MPYKVKKQGDKYVVYKKDTGKRVGSTAGNKEALRKYLAALHLNANEGAIKLSDLMSEAEDAPEKSFEEFADKRYKGAEKIANDAKDKGGVAMLTYNHFVVKLPYYEKATEGEFDLEKGIEEFNKLVKQLSDSAEKVDYGMTEFQKLVGKIECIGELIIRHK